MPIICIIKILIIFYYSHFTSTAVVIIIALSSPGWNDIGFHNPDIKSPNLDQLAHDGIILNQSYVQPLCSPSRAALMSGLYPYRMGLQVSRTHSFSDLASTMLEVKSSLNMSPLAEVLDLEIFTLLKSFSKANYMVKNIYISIVL
ncbi:arylsulfatase B [Elysia marginata]|uniref:Arylsulfatase B n=1 Tax=Elysia marginata TaxID=1093978 RepID=A0AAV4H7H0_9GAST|nr:arylsulfatase B [Elysia marginata]